MTLAAAEAALHQHFGHAGFREGQGAIVASVLDGQDTLAIMPTGGGKSLCYQLPALLREGTTLVVSPLIALMKDQVDALRGRGIPATFINSALDPDEARERLDAMAQGAYKLVYVAPERFRSAAFMASLAQVPIALFAVDEAHCVSQWGHDFRPDYLRLGQVLDRLRPESGAGRPPVLAATATATPEVRADIATQLGLENPRVFVSGFDRPNLRYLVRSCPTDESKRQKLGQILSTLPGTGIVYAATRKNVQKVHEHLTSLGVSSVAYHAGLEDDEREAAQDAWMAGRARVVVATNAFGMGVDKPDVRFVIHHDLPGTPEAYYQEAGRAGRDGKPAFCVLLFAESDRYLQEFFIEGSCPSVATLAAVWDVLLAQGLPRVFLTHTELAQQLPMKVNEMAVGTCLNLLERAGLANRLDRRDHAASVTLLDPEASVRGRLQEAVLSALKTEFGPARLVQGVSADPDALAQQARTSREQALGALSSLAQKGVLDYLPPFRGRGVELLSRVPLANAGLDLAFLDGKQRRALDKLDAMIGFATVTGCRRRYLLDYFGDPSGAGKAASGCGTCDACVPSWRDAAPAPPARGARGTSGNRGRSGAPSGQVRVRQAAQDDDDALPADRLPLYEALRSERTRLSREEAVPPYVVFSDRTLRDLAIQVPQDLGGLLAVKGVGTRKADRYGDAFLAILRNHAHLAPLDGPGAFPDVPEPRRTGRAGADDEGEGAPARMPRASVRAAVLEAHREGLEPSEIAERVGRAASTVEGYLVELAEAGDLDADRLVAPTLADRIRTLAHAMGRPRLAELKEHLGAEVSYLQIRLALGRTATEAPSAAGA